MTHTDQAVEVALAIKAAIEDKKIELAIDEIYYGNQNNIPVGIAVSVTAARKTRELVGVQGPGGRVDNNMFTLIRVYNSRVNSEADERLYVDQLGESIEAVLHEDTTLGGIIIHGFVESIDNGIVYREGSNFRTVELIHRARTRTLL